MNRGFTVVEVLVTLVVIAILLGLGTVGLRSTLANGRDSERKSDTETIARGLERRYKNGNKEFIASSGFSQAGTTSTLASNTYPGALEFKYGTGLPKGEFSPSVNPGGRETMYKVWGFNTSAATSPSGLPIDMVCLTGCAAAEDAAQLATAFSGTNNDRYIYEPVASDGTICSSAEFVYVTCPRFNLYWISETSTETYKNILGLKVIRSRHQ